MVEFLGGPLTELPMGVLPEAVLTASEGEFSYIYTEALPNDVPGHWRAQFDLTVEGDKPVDLRCFLRNGDQVLTETWLYQYHPASTGLRRSLALGAFEHGALCIPRRPVAERARASRPLAFPPPA